jgi:hypothetical protein
MCSPFISHCLSSSLIPTMIICWGSKIIYTSSYIHKLFFKKGEKLTRSFQLAQKYMKLYIHSPTNLYIARLPHNVFLIAHIFHCIGLLMHFIDVLCQMNSDDTLPIYFCTINFNFILPSMPRSSKCSSAQFIDLHKTKYGKRICGLFKFTSLEQVNLRTDCLQHPKIEECRL